jgi:hypothetical protein
MTASWRAIRLESKRKARLVQVRGLDRSRSAFGSDIRSHKGTGATGETVTRIHEPVARTKRSAGPSKVPGSRELEQATPQRSAARDRPSGHPLCGSRRRLAPTAWPGWRVLLNEHTRAGRPESDPGGRLRAGAASGVPASRSGPRFRASWKRACCRPCRCGTSSRARQRRPG